MARLRFPRTAAGDSVASDFHRVIYRALFVASFTFVCLRAHVAWLGPATHADDTSEHVYAGLLLF